MMAAQRDAATEQGRWAEGEPPSAVPRVPGQENASEWMGEGNSVKGYLELK